MKNSKWLRKQWRQNGFGSYRTWLRELATDAVVLAHLSEWAQKVMERKGMVAK